MQLFVNDKEIVTLVTALAEYTAHPAGHNVECANALLSRIERCLALQGKKRAANLKKTDG